MSAKTKDRAVRTAYSASTSSEVVRAIQAIFKQNNQGFSWTTLLTTKEVRFIYDLAAWSEAKKNFMPSEQQSLWAIQILKKIKAVKKDSPKKKPSSRPDMVARRKTKAYLKGRGVTFQKTSPSNFEMALALYDLGALSLKPTKSKAINTLIDWSGKHLKI